MTIKSRVGVAAALVATLALLGGAFAFGYFAQRAGWEWTPLAAFATLALLAAAGVLMLNSRT